MPTDDIRPIDDPPDPAKETSQNKIVAWWKDRSGFDKVLICVAVAVVASMAWHSLSQGDDSKREADIGSQVKTLMQQTFDTDQRFAQYHLVVSKVDVMHKSGNEYEGLAVVHSSRNVDHNVGVHVTAEGDRMMWQSDPGAFAWAAFEQFNSSAPTTAGAS